MLLYEVFIPMALLISPWLIVRYILPTQKTRLLPYLPSAYYLWAATAAWVLAMLLPNIPISPETDTFTMHLMGGVSAAILFLYGVKVYQVTFPNKWFLLAALYFFVSGLGVLNEFFEFFLDASRIYPMPHSDTWWDLLANTTGAFVAIGMFMLVHRVFSAHKLQ